MEGRRHEGGQATTRAFRAELRQSLQSSAGRLASLVDTASTSFSGELLSSSTLQTRSAMASGWKRRLKEE